MTVPVLAAEGADDFPVEMPNKNGWTDWLHPLANYRLACCDCGLVHRLEFRIDGHNQLNFRAKRDERATRKLRAR